MSDSTTRFSDRVRDYVKYRPAYPDEIVTILEEETGLDTSKTIADIGSGTDISSVPFLKKEYAVIGIEPNKEMREAAERLLSNFTNFSSVDGSAEKTNLPGKSIDLLFCGQAFHWFDQRKSKTEFDRVLKTAGTLVLAWNKRSTESGFQRGYEQALYDNLEEYKFVNHRNISDEQISTFFSPKKMRKICLNNQQVLDIEGVKGRLTSTSYCPKSGDQYDQLMIKIEQLFEQYQVNGKVTLYYQTQLYWG